MRKLSFAEALGEAILQEMVRDDSVIVQGEDVGRYGGGYYPALKGLWEKFGSERVRDFPISEIAITGTAVGAALTGLRPIVDIMFADFTFVCFDQIVNQMAKLRYMYGGAISLPIVLRGVHGAYSHLAAQHSQSPEAIFAHFPGLIVVTPSNGKNAKGLLKSAIRCDDTVIYFEHKLLYELPPSDVPPNEDFLIPLGKAEIVREGKDVTIVANSWQTQLSLQAAEILSRRGVEVEVVDLQTIAPMDKETILHSVNKTRRLVAVQEAPPVCGVAAEVIASVMESGVSLVSAPKRVT
ncbi:MAG: alpha-ketoacid dehydrogenase subunit beta, partial [Anaerolineales bacterium]